MSGSIGGVDASIPLQAGRGVQQPNPLQQIGQFAQIQNALNSNRLFPAQQQQLDLANQRSQIGLQSDQSGLIQQQRQLGAAALTPLLAKKGPLSLDDITTALAGAEKSGVVTQPTLADFQGVQITGNPAIDDANFRAHILANSQPPAAAAGAVTPSQGAADVGPSILPYTTGARGMPDQGVVTPVGQPLSKGIAPQLVSTGAGVVPTSNGQQTGPGISNQLSPAQLATPTQIGIDPKTGAPIMGTLEQFLGKTGASPLGTGRFPGALVGPGGAPAAAPGAVPGGGVVTGQGPAQAAAQAATGADSAHAFQSITQQGVQARGQSAILGNMLGDAQNFTTGPQGLNNFKATLQRWAPSVASTFGIDSKSVAANEGFDKLANQIADAQGAGSDARLSVIQHANPGSQLSPAGVDGIIRSLQGNADYLQARSNLAAGYPDKSDSAGFESKIGSNLDPRAFQFARMTPQQKADYAKSLSAPDLAKLKSSYNWSAQNGLIGGANGG